MYFPKDHAESSIPMLRQLIREHPLGLFTTAIPSKTYPRILSSHIPWVLDVQDDQSETELGVLRGHIARANLQSKTMIDEIQTHTTTGEAAVLEEEVLVLFNASPQHYVTPKFYTTTKPDSGKVVPTWNYAAVQAYGRAKIYYNSKSDETAAFLSSQISDLSMHAETSVMGFNGANGRSRAWQVADAPEKYIEILRKNIVGIEIVVDRLEGKFKMSQEMGLGDRQGVVEGFKNLGSEVGDAMSRIVKERSDLKVAAKAQQTAA